MPSRRTLMRGAIGSALLTAGCAGSALLTAGCAGSTEKPAPKGVDKVTHITGFGAPGTEAFTWVAQAKGYFREANIDCTVIPGSAGENNLAALSSGKAHFTEIDYAGALIRGGTGRFDNFRAVAAIHWQTQIAWLTLAGNGINTGAELARRTLAYQPGAVHRTLFPIYAKLAGFDPTTVKWVDGNPQTLATMLANRTVDAIGEYVVSAPAVRQVAKHDITVLGYGDYLHDLYGAVLVTSSNLLHTNRDLVRRYANALMRGLQYTVQNPFEAADILKAAVPGTDRDGAAEGIRGMIPYVRPGQNGAPVGALDQERVARGIALLQGLGSFTDGYDPAKVCDFGLVDESAKLQ